MITSEQIIEIGKFGKPHGINGEISAFIDDDVDIEAIDRIVMDVDGIYVPFSSTHYARNALKRC